MKDIIKELKNTKKGQAIIKLIRWLIFFIILFIIIIISSFINNKSNKPVKNEYNDYNIEENTFKYNIGDTLNNNDFLKIKEQILNGNYSYKYEITLDNIKYIFNGTKTLNEESGYKETSDGVIKYFIDINGIYEERLNERVLIDNLYENLDLNYMNRDNLMNFLDNKEFNLISDYDVLVYNMNNKSYDIYLGIKDDIISYITIKDNNLNYEYSFNYQNVEV